MQTIQGAAGDKHLTVRAYKDILTSIVEPNQPITCENLQSRPFNLKYEEYHTDLGQSRVNFSLNFPHL
jgi:hypothetical protein